MERGAELFNFLSHPVRIGIIKVVHEEGRISFSGLMKALNIESSSLGFHLKQLETCLIRDENRNYDLSEKGRTALRVLHPLKIVGLKQDDNSRTMKESGTPEELRRLIHKVLRARVRPGRWGISIGAFIAIIGLTMFVWNPMYSLLVVAAGIVAVCAGIWINYEETKTLLKFVKEKD